MQTKACASAFLRWRNRELKHATFLTHRRQREVSWIYTVGYLFTGRDDYFENVRETTVLASEMFAYAFHLWLKKVAYLSSNKVNTNKARHFRLPGRQFHQNWVLANRVSLAVTSRRLKLPRLMNISINLLVVYRESVNLIGYITRRLSADSLQLWIANENRLFWTRDACFTHQCKSRAVFETFKLPM